MRRIVASRTEPGRFVRDERMGPGYNELIPEMLGISGPEMYVSDGGHYDNLGLMTLFRARCKTIWCIDASPDTGGTAAELRRVLDLAQAELGVRHDLDLSGFAVADNGLYGTTFAAGNVAYADSVTAELFVVKLGLTAYSSSQLKEYRNVDRGFPHHKTLRQWYARARMESYRDLGFESTIGALEVLDASR